MFNFKNTRLAFDLVTISHTVFVLPLIFSGYLFISKEFVFIDLLLITIASFGARNIAFIFNRYTDREIDKKILELYQGRFHLVKPLINF